jgi:hypothetical protein
MECIRSELRRDEISPRSGPQLCPFIQIGERCRWAGCVRKFSHVYFLQLAVAMATFGLPLLPYIWFAHIPEGLAVSKLHHQINGDLFVLRWAIDTRYCTRRTFASRVLADKWKGQPAGFVIAARSAFYGRLLYSRKRERTNDLSRCPTCILYEETFNHY